MEKIESNCNQIVSRRFQFTLFCFFAAIFMLTFRGISLGDNVFHYEFVKSIIQRQQLSLPLDNRLLQTDRSVSLFFAIGRDDKPYMTLPPGLAVASLPLGSMGFLVESILGDIPHETQEENAENRFDVTAAIRELGNTPSAMMTAMVNPLAMAILAVVFFLFSNRLSRKRKQSLVLTLALGCCTIIWPYSSSYWTQPVTTLSLFSALYSLHLFKEESLQRYIVFAGLLLGFSILTRFETIVLVPFFLIYAVSAAYPDRSRILRTVGRFLAVFCIFVLLLMFWNYYRFGGVLDTGSGHQQHFGGTFRGNLAESIPANLIGLNRSIFVYSPALLLGLLAFPALYRRRRILAMVTTLIIVTVFLLYSKIGMWDAACSWGPRFLVILTPFLLLPASIIRFDARWKRRLLLILAIVGFCIQLIAVLVPHQLGVISDYYKPGNAGDHLLRSDIVPQFKTLFSENMDFWWFANPITVFVGILLILMLLSTGWILVKGELRQDDLKQSISK